MTAPWANSRRATVGRIAAWRAGAALLLWTIALTGLTGCASHLAWLHRGVPSPRVVRAAAPRTPARSAAGPPAPEAAGPLAPYRLAEQAVAAGSPEAAERELREALSRDPAYAPALALLSKLWFQAGRHREAIAMLQPVLQRPETFDPEARRALLAGLALHEDALGRVQDARGAIASARAGDDDPASPDVYVVLRGDSPDSAAALARGALRHDGRSAVNLNNFGITRLRSGDPEGARRAFLDAIGRDASLPGPYYNLAILEQFYRFDDTAAARWFAQYWSRSHDDPDSLRAVFAPRLASVPTGDHP